MICNTCSIDKDLTEFPKRGNGYRGKCKKCTSEYNKPLVLKWREKNHARYREYQNKYSRDLTENLHLSYLKKKFLTIDEFLFTASSRLLILKRTIKQKEYENI